MDEPIEESLIIHGELDPSVTREDAFAVKPILQSILEKTGLRYFFPVRVMGGQGSERYFVLVMTDKPIMKSHDLPDKIGKVTIGYRMISPDFFDALLAQKQPTPQPCTPKI